MLRRLASARPAQLGGIIVLMLASHWAMPAVAEGASIDDIINWRSYSETFASSGQPTAAQLAVLSEQGYERIIYIAFSDHKHSLAGEDRLVKELGMQYLHLPIIWTAPSAADFAVFASTMRTQADQKTLLHCQVNYRASAFALLYRVIHEGVPLATAKAAMDSVWTPDATWTRFIRQVLTDHGVDPDCDDCDWTPAQS